MAADGPRPHPGIDEDTQETANDQFRDSFRSWFWGSMIVATVLHFAVFVFFPELTAEDLSYSAEEMESIALPPEVSPPAPPERLTRPAAPVVSETAMDEDLTIGFTTFEANRPDELPPPTDEDEGGTREGPVLTPFTTPPQATNVAEVRRALEEAYPPLLRDAGIGGVVEVWLFIDTEGRVQDARVAEGSGHPRLDQAALDVAPTYRFTPALNGDEVVPVWVSIPIRFEVHRPAAPSPSEPSG